VQVVNYQAELKKRGWSLRRLAQQVDKSEVWLRSVLSGKAKASADTEDKILKALNLCACCRRPWPEKLRVER
jgi:lambda repressor-like predicted transcriptional regulator